MKLLVTGASGFVGQAFCKRALECSYKVLGTHLPIEFPSVLLEGVEPVVIESIGPDTNWTDALRNVDTVIHLAARVHIINDVAKDSLSEYRRVNTKGTAHLASQSVLAGVRRFIFISSIKVNGEGRDFPYTEQDNPTPEDPYGISKWEAEQLLTDISEKTGLEIVILRLPLIYGPGVKANFLLLMDIVNKGIPLPLGCINNKRSMLFLGNLVDAIITCVNHPMAANQTFLVSDGEDVSTSVLVQRIAISLGKKARIIYVPNSLIRFAGKLLGKSAEVNKLLSNLVIDSSKINTKLGWTPRFTMEEGLDKTAEWYKTSRRDFIKC